MKRLMLGTASSILAIGLAFAQTAAPPAASTPPPPASTMAPAGSTMGAPATPNSMGTPAGKAAASGNDNQAVVTTKTNADQPAKGANSFTRHQAMSRIAAKGYSQVKSLKKDHDGVWRGMGMKDGQSVGVWLDYKGNVGQQAS